MSALACFTIEGDPKVAGRIINNYNPLTQAGVPIKNNRNAAWRAELSAFVAFLTDFTATNTRLTDDENTDEILL